MITYTTRHGGSCPAQGQLYPSGRIITIAYTKVFILTNYFFNNLSQSKLVNNNNYQMMVHFFQYVNFGMLFIDSNY